MRKQRIGHTEVAFAVFEIDGVHFVWHCRRPHFPFHDLLLEVIHGDVRPNVPVQIDQHSVNATKGIAPRRKVIVRLDLGGHFCSRQTEAPLHKFTSKLWPVHVGIRHMVRIELSRCTAKLGRIRGRSQRLSLSAKAIHKDLDFFPQRDRRSGLSVSARQHGHRFPRGGQRCEVGDQSVQQGHHSLFCGALQGQRNGRVVHVL